MANSTAPARQRKQQVKFPLWIRKGGTNGKPRWCRKIGGKLYYFGYVADDPHGEAALQRWAKHADDLLAGRSPRQQSDDANTLDEVCRKFIEAKDRKLEAGEITHRTRKLLKMVCDALCKHFGKSRRVDDIRPEEFGEYRRLLAERFGPVQLGQELSRAKSVFKFAFENGLIAQPVRFGTEFAPPSRKTLRLHRASKGERMLTPVELRKLIDAANPRMRAMILLALNCGFGNHDCATLPRTALDLDNSWLRHPRPKTGVDRRIPLWPQTVKALRAALATSKDDELVFTTKYGGNFAKLDSTDNPIAKVFRELADRCKLSRRATFYDLRHIHRTVADGAKDQPTANSIMGHVDDSMAGAYRERIDDERLVAVTDHVRQWLYGKPEPKAKASGKRGAK